MTTLQTLAAAGLLMGAVLLSGSLSKAAPSLLPAPKRSIAPIFVLKDPSGKDVRLGDFKGKVVLLNFWATWCGPCKAEIPWFNEFQKKHASAGLAVLGVSMDEEGWKVVRPYLQKMAVSYQVALGDEGVAAKYGGIDSLPLTLLIDREGRIAARHVGLTSKSNYEDDIAQLLRQ
ncbi:MAG: TlpA disulfide reductase family protein [Bryobacteraceae bacterium]